LHSYEVAIVNNIVTTSYDELLDYHSLDIYAVKTDGIMRKYIRMWYDLADCENYDVNNMYIVLWRVCKCIGKILPMVL
jgi:hypothetical protein